MANEKPLAPPPPDPKHTEDARQAVQEYADDQREIVRKLRRKLN